MKENWIKGILAVTIGVVCCLCCFQNYAQSPALSLYSSPVNNKNEGAFLQQVKRLQLNADISRTFVQEKTIQALQRPLISKGTIVLSKKGVCMVTTMPFSSAVKVTEEGIWQKMGAQKATLKSAKDHFEIKHTARIMVALFTANQKTLEKQFHLFYLKTNDGFQIGLRPKDKILSKIISTIVIAGTNEIRKIHIQEANGDETRISISPQVPLKKISFESCVQ